VVACRPGGAKISLAVSRVRHISPDADYQGVMLVNPGAGAGLAGPLEVVCRRL